MEGRPDPKITKIISSNDSSATVSLNNSKLKELTFFLSIDETKERILAIVQDQGPICPAAISIYAWTPYHQTLELLLELKREKKIEMKGIYDGGVLLLQYLK